MADEQDFNAYADQAFLASNDTLIAAKANGSGVNVAGAHIMSRIAAAGPYVAEGDVSVRSNAALSLNLGSVSATPDHTAAIRYLNRQNLTGNSADGQIGAEIRFTRVGNAPAYRITFATTNAASGAPFDRWYIDATGHFRPSVDATLNIGQASERVNVVFAATGTINTSDERDKDWGGRLSDDEYAAGLEIINELGWYQWKDAVAEKGRDGARFHFGARAQRVFAILDKHIGEGAWKAYAFACYDQWAEQALPPVGEELSAEEHSVGDRYGLRIDQLTMFLLAVMARQNAGLEARLSQLEAVE